MALTRQRSQKRPTLVPDCIAQACSLRAGFAQAGSHPRDKKPTACDGDKLQMSLTPKNALAACRIDRQSRTLSSLSPCRPRARVAAQAPQRSSNQPRNLPGALRGLSAMSSRRTLPVYAVLAEWRLAPAEACGECIAKRGASICQAVYSSLI
jgi:hypothetical protein